MSKVPAFAKISDTSPFWFIAFWSIIMLANFIDIIPQPATELIIGYEWKVEFALAGLILLSILFALKFSQNKLSFINFSRFEVSWIILPLLLFTIWSALSLIWAESLRNALHHTLLWACYIVFYLLVRQIVSRPRLLDASLKITGMVFATLGLTCSILYFSIPANYSVNISLTYSKYAEDFSTLLPLFIALTINKKSRHSFLFGTIGIITWLGVIFSLGRTQFLAGLSGVFIFAVFTLLKSRREISPKKAVVFFSFFVLITIFSQLSTISNNFQQTTFNRFSNGEQNQTSIEARFLFWEIALESFKQNPLFGVGADNFVTNYGKARGNYAELHPESSGVKTHENILPERAHNEYLQILSELGIVGIFFFGWFLLGIAKLVFSLRKNSASPLSIASLAGIFAFLVSSTASSYSFRFPANGACFFFVLSLAASGLLKEECRETEKRFDFNWLKLKPLFMGFSLIICFVMLTFSVVRGVSLMYMQRFLSGSDAEAEYNIQNAIALDNEEALFKFYYGVQLYNLTRVEEAIPLLRFSIDHGIVIPTGYFYLASAQIIARKTAEAEQTFIESLRVFPQSVFLRTAYASFLKEEGKYPQAEIEYKKACQINPEQARSWQIAHDEGLEKLSQAVAKDNNLVEGMDLKPFGANMDLSNFHRQHNPKLVEK